MPPEDKPDTPKLTWTFPVLTRVQQAQLGRLGSNIGALVGRVGSSSSSDSSSNEKPDTSSNDDVEELEDSINELDVSSTADSSPLDLDYSDSEDPDGMTVEIEDESFVPVHADIEVGQAVTWVNNSDTSHRVTDVDRQLFTSDVLSPGEEYTYEFEEEGAVVYRTTMAEAPMYGAVLVGDVDKPALPTDIDTEPETFDVSSGDTRTLTQAAEDKEEMDVGF